MANIKVELQLCSCLDFEVFCFSICICLQYFWGVHFILWYNSLYCDFLDSPWRRGSHFRSCFMHTQALVSPTMFVLRMTIMESSICCMMECTRHCCGHELVSCFCTEGFFIIIAALNKLCVWIKTWILSKSTHQSSALSLLLTGTTVGATKGWKKFTAHAECTATQLIIFLVSHSKLQFSKGSTDFQIFVLLL